MGELRRNSTQKKLFHDTSGEKKYWKTESESANFMTVEKNMVKRFNTMKKENCVYLTAFWVGFRPIKPQKRTQEWKNIEVLSNIHW